MLDDIVHNGFSYAIRNPYSYIICSDYAGYNFSAPPWDGLQNICETI
jgi:hypothetical protein